VTALRGTAGGKAGNNDVTDHGNRPVEDVILELALAQWTARGVAVTVERAPEGYRLNVPGTDVVFFLANVTAQAKELDPGEWEDLVRRFVQQQFETQSDPRPETLRADDLRRQVRTRLLSDAPDEFSDTAYARPFAPGLIQVLCVDYPQAVITISSQVLPQLALPVDELYAAGQANTDAEPVDERMDFDEFVHALVGDSFFIASKAANFSALVPAVIGPAPFGVVFAVPDRHLLIYSAIDPQAWTMQIMRVAVAGASIGSSPDTELAGGAISLNAYYWAPDGTVEQIAAPYTDTDGQQTIGITTRAAFKRYVPIGAPQS
jgi:hypothetical protein